jgi:hypothetical protein
MLAVDRAVYERWARGASEYPQRVLRFYLSRPRTSARAASCVSRRPDEMRYARPEIGAFPCGIMFAERGS